uniref:Uncharacterized protein n=1 Tax=Arundo donax TaxID=35708 RepID=A0A0A9GWA8_ARUDO
MGWINFKAFTRPALAPCFNSISNLKLPLAPPHCGHSVMFLS